MTQQKTKQNDATLPLFNLHSISTARKFRGRGAQPPSGNHAHSSCGKHAHPSCGTHTHPSRDGRVTKRGITEQGRTSRASRQSLSHASPVWTGGDLHGQSSLFGSVTNSLENIDSQFTLSIFKLIISITNVGRVSGEYVHLVYGEYMWAFCCRREAQPIIIPCPTKTPEYHLPWPSLQYPNRLSSFVPIKLNNQDVSYLKCILEYRVFRTNQYTNE